MKVIVLSLLLVATISRNYPLYKQCDPKWGNQQIGTSSKTICQVGCLMSSVAMALSGVGHNYNPSTLNSWLKGHGGYVGGDQFVWASVDKIGLTYHGKISNSHIKANLDANNIVILNVHEGRHYVLATGYSGDSIHVHDPGFQTTAYTLHEIVEGHTSLYKV